MVKSRNKNKVYKFTQEGLRKAIADEKNEKVSKWVDIGIWVVIIGLCGYGVVRFDTVVKMVCCSGVSRVVKWIVG
jgi:hypothetical protein